MSMRCALPNTHTNTAVHTPFLPPNWAAGVGKTELAKALASMLFDSEKMLVSA